MRLHKTGGGLSPVLVIFSLFIAVPFITLLVYTFFYQGESWQHVRAYLLIEPLTITFFILLGVVILSALFGIGSALLIAFLDFPARAVLRFLLILPLATPAYIVAFTYRGMFDYMGLSRFTFTPILSTTYILAITLFPYVYLVTLLNFENQSRQLFLAARCLGRNWVSAFWAVVFPAARPAIIAGMSIVIMETVAEFGAPSLLGAQTLTVTIMRIWSGMGDFVTAAQLSGYLFICILLIFFIEQYSREAVSVTSRQTDTVVRRRPQWAWLCTLFCGTVFAISFLLPVCFLLYLAFQSASNDLLDVDLLFSASTTSLWMAFFCLGLLLASALTVSYTAYGRQSVWLSYLLRFMTMGYAVPGLVIAISLFVPLAQLDHLLSDIARTLLATDMSFSLVNGVLVLFYAYIIRFFASAFNPIYTRLGQVSASVNEAAACFGLNKFSCFCKVQLPIVRHSIFAACILVFIEVLKELPITLILRPVNMTTLAVQVYELASDERLMQAALPSLLIIALSCYAVYFLYRTCYARSQ